MFQNFYEIAKISDSDADQQKAGQYIGKSIKSISKLKTTVKTRIKNKWKRQTYGNLSLRNG